MNKREHFELGMTVLTEYKSEMDCNINRFDINRRNRNVFINETENHIIQMDVEKFCVLLTLGCIDRNSM